VARTAPDCVAMAERRMREINAAYEILSRPKAG
jgi:curved DNA-binding protein CbpA